MSADVLAVGPHPDDVELAAGGTVAGLAAAGFRVELVDLTAGERSTRGTPEGRAVEAAAAAAALGAAHRRCLGLADGGLSRGDPGQLAALVEAVRTARPRLVLGLHENDDHPDHIEGAHLLRRAVYLAGVRNYPEPGGNPHRVGRVLFAMGRRPFVPSLVVDVTGQYEAKRAALAAYASQFHRAPEDPLVTPISDPGFLDMIEARDRTYGARCGFSLGEPFFEDGPAGIASVASLVPGGLR